MGVGGGIGSLAEAWKLWDCWEDGVIGGIAGMVRVYVCRQWIWVVGSWEGERMGRAGMRVVVVGSQHVCMYVCTMYVRCCVAGFGICIYVPYVCMLCILMYHPNSRLQLQSPYSQYLSSTV